ncbi:MAG: hypothetical protein UY63_C0007G0025 [Parcubacteria group bacterium GW2011_GWA2_51_10]|nr:MAG: hypothetical protein UY63_C0007G0025 [Parcubacteria group bacterium GW2011_GWA2_51_10]
MNKQQSLKDLAREYVGDRGLAADAGNSVMSISINMDDSTAAHLMKRALRYEDYIRTIKFPKNSGLADEIMRASDPSLIAQFDDLVDRMNAELKKETPTEEKNAMLQQLLDDFWKLMG